MNRKIRSDDAESGYVLVAVIFLAVIVLINLAVAAPKIAVSLQREKEREAIHRGEQYRRAIRLYYRTFGRYPTSIDQLVNTNNMRFLRRRYTDPMTGKDDWKPVLFGQAHVRPTGFFGQPLLTAGRYGAAVGSMYAVSQSPAEASDAPGAEGQSSADGTDAGWGSGQAGADGNAASEGGGSEAGPDPSASLPGAGGPIVGVRLPVDKPSLLGYMEQTRYSHWEFNYDPQADLLQPALVPNGPAPGTPSNGAPGMTSGSGGTPSSGIYGSSDPSQPSQAGRVPNSVNR